MRTLKDGTIKYKPSALESAKRMEGKPFPLKVFPRNTKVQVFMGAGWSAGYVLQSFQDKCMVKLTVGDRIITVNDNRCIRIFEK